MWNGLVKSYQVLRVIPVHEMTREDWRLLDYENLRSTAQNRIVDTAMKGMAGFAWVNIYQKGRAKPNYLMPVTPTVAAEFIETGKIPFTNEAEETIKPTTLKFNNAVDSIYLTIGTYSTARFVDYSIEQARAAEAEKVAEEFEKMVANGIADFNELDAALAIALELLPLIEGSSSEDRLTALSQFIDEADEALGLADDRGLL